MRRRPDVGDTRMGRGNSQVREKRELCVCVRVCEGRGRRVCACVLENGCNKATWLVSTC